MRSEHGRLDEMDGTAAADAMDRLELGVAHGIITAAQRDALLALSAHPDVADVETRRGLNAVTVAYWTGGIAVLSAFGWFLISNWSQLGARGVLVVSLVYASLFVLTARVLGQHGFRHASAIATTLAVGMAPISTWAGLWFVGLWDLFPTRRYGFGSLAIEPAWDSLRWLPVDLATILAALVALRRVRFGVLALPIAIATWAAVAHSFALFVDPELMRPLSARASVLPAVGLLAVGYALEVRANDGEDYSRWFYLVGLVALTVALVSFYSGSPGVTAHAALAIAAILAVAAIRLRRLMLLLAAFVGLVSYLAYLTFDLFDKALGFPVALATIGLVVILIAVWLQRRYPALVRRSAAPETRAIPGAPLALAGALVIAITLVAVEIPETRRRVAERYERERVDRARMHNVKKRDSLRIQPPGVPRIR
jgi:hypothetical protein